MAAKSKTVKNEIVKNEIGDILYQGIDSTYGERVGLPLPTPTEVWRMMRGIGYGDKDIQMKQIQLVIEDGGRVWAPTGKILTHENRWGHA